MNKHIKYFSLALVIIVSLNSTSICQDIKSPYFNSTPLLNGDLETYVNGYGFPIGFYRDNNATGYDGEYEIILSALDFFWGDNSMGPISQTYLLSYDMEILSFPFVPDCYTLPNGCTGQTTRSMYMPNSFSPYDANTDSWGVIRRKKPITKLENTESQSLASIAYRNNTPLVNGNGRYYLPHTIIKHTIYVHCENHNVSSPSTPPIYSVSWIYDNTRGAMKEYPFCNCNCTSCSLSEYDVTFIPKLLHNTSQHYYNENNSSLLLPNGTLNYFDFSSIQTNSCAIPFLVHPNHNDQFYSSAPIAEYKKVYIAPYSLISAPLMQFRGKAPAGYVNNTITIPGLPPTGQFDRLPGILHSYNIDRNIDIVNSEISESNHIFYNPSDVTITAADLHFPSYYSFRTISGEYPSPAEVQADNTAINGGPFNDLRDVPVRTDLRSEDPAFPDDASIPDDAKYASLYRLASGSKLTLEPCVRVFDAAFILNPGSTLELANKTSIIGLHRVAIDRYGGRLIEKYELNSGTLYLQDKIETALAPNTYYVNSKIFAGENVEPSSPIGPYIASTGTDLELIARDYIKLDHGFHAEPGSEVKIQIDPFMQIPACPPPASGGSGNRFANLSANSIVDASAHIKLLPTLFTNSTGIYSENKNEDPIISVEVLDASGKKIKQINEINDYFIEVDLSSMNDGMYFFIIQTNNNRKVLKGVKQN